MTRRSCVSALTILAVLGIASTLEVSGQEKKPPKVTYDDHVKPVLRAKCFSCHNPDKKSGDLDLTNYTNLMQGGGSGSVIEPGDASGSYLYALITHQDEPFMPPESPKLPDEMIETVRKWIDGGVLENAGSKAIVSDKPKFDLALSDAPSGRPKVAPLPARLVLEPVTRTSRATTVSSIATSPWSPLAAVASQSQILLYNTQTLDLLGVLPFPEGTPEILKFSRNGALLLAGGGQGGASGKVIVWNITTGQRVIEVGDELETVLAADISSDQRLIALGGPQRVVRIYTTEDGRMIHELRKHTDWVNTVEFSPDGVLLATGDRNGGMFVWEAYTGREYLMLKGHTAAITAVSWRLDSNILASSSEDASIKLWEMENGSAVKSWAAHGGGAAFVEFARDGRLVSCGRDKVTKLWDQNGKQLVAFEAFADLAVRASICDETNRAIAGDWNGEVRVWNAADGKRVGQLSANPPTLSERTEAAKAALAAAQATAKPLLDANLAAQSAVAKLKADMLAAQQALAAAQKKQVDAQAKQDLAAKNVATVGTEHKTLSDLHGKLAAAVPGLQQAAAATGEAAKKLEADKELAATAAKLQQLADGRTAELAQRQKELTAKTAQLAAANQALTASQSELAAATAASKQAAELLAKLTPLVKPAEDKALATKQAADAAASQVASAQQDLGRWQGELLFAQKVQELKAKRLAAEQLLGQRKAELAAQQTQHKAQQAELDAAGAKLAGLQNTRADKQKQQVALTTQIATAKKEMEVTTAARAKVQQDVTRLDAANVDLQLAVAKAKEASGKDAGDKKLEAAAAALAQLLAERTKLSQAGATSITQYDTKLVALQKTIADSNGKVTSLQAEVLAFQKQEADVATALKAVETKLAAAVAAVAKAQADVDQASKAVQQHSDELALARSTPRTAGS